MKLQSSGKFRKSSKHNFKICQYKSSTSDTWKYSSFYKKNKIFISSTNLEISASVQVGAKIEEEGEISVPAKVISELVANLPKETINFVSEKEQLKISSSGFTSTVLGMNSSDFPKIPNSVDKDKSISFSQNRISKSIGASYVCNFNR